VYLELTPHLLSALPRLFSSARNPGSYIPSTHRRMTSQFCYKPQFLRAPPTHSKYPLQMDRTHASEVDWLTSMFSCICCQWHRSPMQISFLRGDNTSKPVIWPGPTIGSGGKFPHPPGNSSTAKESAHSNFNSRLRDSVNRTRRRSMWSAPPSRSRLGGGERGKNRTG